MFRKLTYMNIKGMQETLDLDRLTVLSGPNESGKSAAVEALRLATTGKASIGSQAKAQAKLTSGDASAVAYSDEFECNWTLVRGKKNNDGPDTQGDMPLTVGEFWALTGTERLKLIAPDGQLKAIYDTIEKLEQDKKKLKATIEAPSIPTPEKYEGPSVESLRAAQAAANEAISKHNAAAALKAIKDEALGIEEKIEHQKVAIQGKQDALEACRAELKKVGEQLSKYNESVSNEPRIISSARSRGLNARQAFESTLSLVEHAAKWLDKDVGSQVAVKCEELTQLIPETFVPDVPLAIYGERPVAEVHRELMQSEMKLVNEIETAKTELQRMNNALERSKKPLEGLMSDEEFAKAVVDLEAVEGQMQQAGAWKTYQDMAQKDAQARAAAMQQLEQVEAELKDAKNQRDQTAKELVGELQSHANAMLKKAGLAPLSISISSTARSVSLDVSIGSVAIEAMAQSRRLLYGLCLLAAIHDMSKAACPVLVAECAEMDINGLDKAIEAMELKRKGNVVLEHWAKPTRECNLIDLSSGVLV